MLSADFIWSGRNDPEDGKSAIRWHHAVNDQNATNAIGLIGFACDIGVERNKGRTGAAEAPDILRAALCNLAWHGKAGICDNGTIRTLSDKSGDPLLTAQNALGDTVAQTLAETGKAIVLGGGHETAFGSLSGLKAYSGKRIGIINLDAHFDIRLKGENGYSSGTPFTHIRQVMQEQGQDFQYMVLGISRPGNTKALFDRADNWSVKYIEDKDVSAETMPAVLQAVDEFLNSIDVLYLSLDLDVLPHWQMQAVSAPSGYGVDIGLIERIIRHIGSSGIHWPLADIVEFNPSLDTNGCSVRSAARLIDTIAREMCK